MNHCDVQLESELLNPKFARKLPNFCGNGIDITSATNILIALLLQLVDNRKSLFINKNR